MHIKINESNLCTKLTFKKKGLQFTFKNINGNGVLNIRRQAVPKKGCRNREGTPAIRF